VLGSNFDKAPVLGADLLPMMPRKEQAADKPSVITEIIERLQAEKAAQEAAKIQTADLSAVYGKGMGANSVYNVAGPNVGGINNIAQTKHARRVYIGNIPQGVTDKTLIEFLVEVVSRTMNPQAARESILSIHVNPDKCYSFVEFSTIELTEALTRLDGLKMHGQVMKIRRPNDYRPELVHQSSLGPIPELDRAGLGIISTAVSDGPNKIFIGGIPTSIQDDSLKEILGAFGQLKAFNLVRDPGAALTKGYAFCEYVDTNITTPAIEALNGFTLLDKQLTVKVATGPNGTKNTALPPLPLAIIPTMVVVLKNMVSADEVNDDAEYEDILEDVKGECSQYGSVISVVIPRSKEGYPVEVVGNIFVQFSTIMDATNATRGLSGRKFADNTVQCDYFPLEKFLNGVYVD
jgi:splicing factor U2AF 65 kDa subunit